MDINHANVIEKSNNKSIIADKGLSIVDETQEVDRPDLARRTHSIDTRGEREEAWIVHRTIRSAATKET